jgi:hypothetical protein
MMGVRQGVRQGSARTLPTCFCWLFVCCLPATTCGCQGCTERSRCSPGHLAFVVGLEGARVRSLPAYHGRSFAPDPENPDGQGSCPSNPRPGFDHQAARRSTRRQAVPTGCFVLLVFSVGHSAFVCSSGETGERVHGASDLRRFHILSHLCLWMNNNQTSSAALKNPSKATCESVCMKSKRTTDRKPTSWKSPHGILGQDKKSCCLLKAGSRVTPQEISSTSSRRDFAATTGRKTNSCWKMRNKQGRSGVPVLTVPQPRSARIFSRERLISGATRNFVRKRSTESFAHQGECDSVGFVPFGTYFCSPHSYDKDCHQDHGRSPQDAGGNSCRTGNPDERFVCPDLEDATQSRARRDVGASPGGRDNPLHRFHLQVLQG